MICLPLMPFHFGSEERYVHTGRKHGSFDQLTTNLAPVVVMGLCGTDLMSFSIELLTGPHRELRRLAAMDRILCVVEKLVVVRHANTSPVLLRLTIES